MSRRRRVCIMSGGGDAPGVNAILRAFVHAASRHSIDVIGSRYGFEGLLAPDGLVSVTIDDVRGVLPRGGCFLGCSTRINPFFVETATGQTADRGPAIVERLKREVEGLVLIGGDGTMLAARRFTSLGLPCIGIPKTIDNDLGGTDVTCGFDSALDTATRAIDTLHSTAEAHARVMLVEVMGRNAGFVALSAGIAGGADVVLIPEFPYHIDRIVQKVRERERLGLRFSIVVVAEGCVPIDGDAANIEAERPGHLPRLGGAGDRLMRALRGADLQHETRLTVLGHLQRGGTPSPFDRLLGTQFGAHAMTLVTERTYGRMVSLRDGRITSVDLNDFPLHRRIDPHGQLVTSAREIGIEICEASS